MWGEGRAFMPPWASWSGFPLPGSEMTLPGVSAVWDQVWGHRGLGAPRVLTSPSTLCRDIPQAPAAVPSLDCGFQWLPFHI